MLTRIAYIEDKQSINCYIEKAFFSRFVGTYINGGSEHPVTQQSSEDLVYDLVTLWLS